MSIGVVIGKKLKFENTARTLAAVSHTPQQASTLAQPRSWCASDACYQQQIRHTQLIYRHCSAGPQRGKAVEQMACDRGRNGRDNKVKCASPRQRHAAPRVNTKQADVADSPHQLV